jgi:hypothetical protein
MKNAVKIVLKVAFCPFETLKGPKSEKCPENGRIERFFSPRNDAVFLHEGMS